VADEPDVHNVRGTNFCDVRPHAAAGRVIIVTSAIDNLVKGGSGQAVQNLNLMAGFRETLGLPVLGGGV
ncbi:MAG: N-acetyl-gamma-glutamyl-phosphate reductase, partial [Thermoplasmatota archaeon]